MIGVIDDGTIEVQFGDGSVDQVRLLGIEAVDRADPPGAAACGGPQGGGAIAAALLGRTVLLERGAPDRDGDGRLLRYVWVDGELVNETLVQAGAADAGAEPAGKYQGRIQAAKQQARASGQGIWAACGAGKGAPAPAS